MNAVIQAIYNYLTTHGPQRRYGHLIARDAGVGSDEWTLALHEIRSPKFIEDHGWTIPYVGHGPGLKNPYAVFHTNDPAAVQMNGSLIRSSDVLSSLKRLDAHLDLTSIAKLSSTEAKFVGAVSSAVKSMIATGNALGL